MDVFDLTAKISLDSSEYERGLDGAKEKTSVFGDVFKANIASAVVQKGFSMLVDGAKKAASGFVSLTKSAVEGYASYEQNWGGIQKLYGTAGKTVEEYAQSVGKSVSEVQGDYNNLTKAQNLVLENANNAFKTAGMSAQTYMETATQFSASLISSLGGDTVKAAQQTDVAMRAISDNVNTFGTNMEDVTNAFKGFSKQNYTMLDNLKLGYGGTKQEMERLIDDANEYAASIGQASDLSIDSFSDIVTAIELIQEKQGIAGTTAREAASTVEGSVNMVKAAWENLVAGIANPDADLGQLIDDLVDSAEQAFNNILPVVERAIEGIGDLVTRITPIVAEKLPQVAAEIGPVAGEAIGTIIGALVQNLPSLLDTLFESVKALIQGFLDGLGVDIDFDSAFQPLNDFVEKLQPGFDAIKQSASDAFSGISEAASDLWSVLEPILQPVIDFFTSAEFWNAILEGIAIAIQIVSAAIEAIITVITTVIDVITTVVGVIADFVQGLVDAATTIGGDISSAFSAFGDLIADIADKFASFFSSVGDGIASFVSNVQEKWDSLKQKTAEVWDNVKQKISEAWDNVKSKVKEGAENVKSKVTEGWDNVKQKTSDAWDNVKQKVSDSWSDIKSKAADGVENVKSKVQEGWDNLKSKTSEAWDNIKQKISEKWRSITSDSGSHADQLTSKISSAWDKAKSKTAETWENIRSKISDKITSAKSTVSSMIDKIKGAFNFSWHLPHLSLPHIKISGKFSLKPPSAPHFSISWYKKAMEDPFMFSNATLFGAGEAGDEILYGRQNLLDDIKDAMGSVTYPEGAVIESNVTGQINEMLALLRQYMPTIGNQQVVLDSGAIVGKTAPLMNQELARINGRRAFA